MVKHECGIPKVVAHQSSGARKGHKYENVEVNPDRQKRAKLNHPRSGMCDA